MDRDALEVGLAGELPALQHHQDCLHATAVGLHDELCRSVYRISCQSLIISRYKEILSAGMSTRVLVETSTISSTCPRLLGR